MYSVIILSWNQSQKYLISMTNKEIRDHDEKVSSRECQMPQLSIGLAQRLFKQQSKGNTKEVVKSTESITQG